MADNSPSVMTQVTKFKPDQARAYSLIGENNVRIPRDPDAELLLDPFATPRGLVDGIYHIEFYDESGAVIELPPTVDARLIISRGAKPPKAEDPPQPAKRVNRTVLYRQHVELRELVMEDINHMVKVREVVRREFLETQQTMLDEHKKLMEERHRLLERERELIERERLMNTGATEGKPAADYTQLGLGLLDTVKSLAESWAVGGKKKGQKRLNEVLEEVVKMADPEERQKMVDDPAGWTKRVASLAGSTQQPASKRSSTALVVSKDPEKPAPSPEAKTVPATSEQTKPTPSPEAKTVPATSEQTKPTPSPEAKTVPATSEQTAPAPEKSR